MLSFNRIKTEKTVDKQGKVGRAYFNGVPVDVHLETGYLRLSSYRDIFTTKKYVESAIDRLVAMTGELTHVSHWYNGETAYFYHPAIFAKNAFVLDSVNVLKNAQAMWNNIVEDESSEETLSEILDLIGEDESSEDDLLRSPELSEEEPAKYTIRKHIGISGIYLIEKVGAPVDKKYRPSRIGEVDGGVFGRLITCECIDFLNDKVFCVSYSRRFSFSDLEKLCKGSE